MISERPSGGHVFEAVLLLPEGWMCLSPWITTPDGYWWRATVSASGYGEEAKQWANHMAKEINAAMKERTDGQ